MDRVCIFGVDGFTGRHLQKYIRTMNLTQEFEFFGYSRKTIPNEAFPISVLEATNRNDLSAAIIKLKPQYIINLIGSPQVSTIDHAVTLNAGISKWICEIITENKIPIKKFLAIGSANEYGHAHNLPIQETHPFHPISYYGLAKLWQTTILQFFYRTAGIPINIARTFNIVGSDMPSYLSIGSFVEQIRKASNGTVIKVGNLETRRDFLAIDDVVDAYWKILTNAPAGNVYNVCSGKSYAVSELLTHLINASGKNIKIQSEPELSRTQDQIDIYGDNLKLRSAVKWVPSTDILVALTKIVKGSE
jgi:GDP-4-dehydro-6-deoxy-D-mannose reductase